MLLVVEDLYKEGGIEPQCFNCGDALHVEFLPGEVDGLDGSVDLGSMLLKALKVWGVIEE